MSVFFSCRGFGFVLAAVCSILSGCAEHPGTTVIPTEAVRARIAESLSQPMMIHVWATWCDPCREEFPVIAKVCRQYASSEFHVLLLSADDPKDIEAVDLFLKQYECDAESHIAARLDDAFIKTLSPKWSGALPSTFFFSGGKLVHHWEGARTFDEYQGYIDTLLKQ